MAQAFLCFFETTRAFNRTTIAPKLNASILNASQLYFKFLRYQTVHVANQK